MEFTPLFTRLFAPPIRQSTVIPLLLLLALFLTYLLIDRSISDYHVKKVIITALRF